MSDGDKTSWKIFVEEVEVSGKHLLDEINRLMAEGNVRKLVIKSGDGDVFLSLPLTAGAVAGGILTLGAPWLAILVAVAGLLAQVRVEITREQAPPSEASAKSETPESNPPGTQS
jgi:CBS domain-containing protein